MELRSKFYSAFSQYVPYVFIFFVEIIMEQEVPRTSSVCCLTTVLFHVSCKSSYKLLTLIKKIENCYYYLIPEAATKGWLYKIEVLAKSLKKSLKEFVFNKVTDCRPQSC